MNILFDSYIKKSISFLQTYKTYLFFLIPLVLIIFFIISISFSSYPKRATINKTTNEVTPSNTSTLLAEKLQVKETSPANNTTNVSIYPSISVTFVQTFSHVQQKTLTFTFSPSIEGKESWSSDGKTVTFTPSQALSSNTKYTILTTMQNATFAWGFTTVSSENISIEDKQKVQDQADQHFGEWQQSVNAKYPWYLTLPLQTDTYFFYFDLTSKSFIGLLYPSLSSKTAVDSQVASMKTTIEAQLTKLNIPYAKYPITWSVTPEP